MRCLRLAALLLFTYTPAGGAQTGAPPKPLRLTSAVLSRRSCAGGAGVDFLHMRLRLRFTNVGDRRLILYRGDNLFFTVWVSPATGEPSAARYELKTSAARFRTTGAEDVDAADEHLLRVTASSWYESKGLGEKLRERWRRKGELWLDPVVSEPMRFSSGEPGSAERCQ